MSKRDFPNTYIEASRYGDMAVKQMKSRLRQADKDGGELDESIRYRIRYTENGIEVKFLMSKTADYVEQGRKARGNDKTHDPPVVKRWSTSNLKKWMNRKGINEKNKYAIARKIGRDGIEPYKFRFVTNTLWRQYEKRYEAALKKDYEMQLQKLFKQELRKK